MKNIVIIAIIITCVCESFFEIPKIIHVGIWGAILILGIILFINTILKINHKPEEILIKNDDHKEMFGFDTREEVQAFERGQFYCQDMMMEQIKEWDGISTDSGLKSLLMQKFNEIKNK